MSPMLTAKSVTAINHINGFSAIYDTILNTRYSLHHCVIFLKGLGTHAHKRIRQPH